MAVTNNRSIEDHIRSLLEKYRSKEEEDRLLHDSIVCLERSKRDLDEKVIEVLSGDLGSPDKRQQREALAVLREKIVAQQIAESKRWWAVRGDLEDLRCQLQEITGWDDQDLAEQGFKPLPPV